MVREARLFPGGILLRDMADTALPAPPAVEQSRDKGDIPEPCSAEALSGTSPWVTLTLLTQPRALPSAETSRNAVLNISHQANHSQHMVREKLDLPCNLINVK